MRSRDSFGAVLETLRERLQRGVIPPGAPLIVLDLAADLRVSATPVREALAYLGGEGLIDGRRGRVRGYMTWTPTADDLADLLRLHQALVLTALERRPLLRPQVEVTLAAEGGDLASQVERIFAQVVAAGGGGVFQREHRLVADRLHLFRRREPLVFCDLAAELAGLARDLAGPEAARSVRTYHRRRLDDVARLAALLA